MRRFGPLSVLISIALFFLSSVPITAQVFDRPTVRVTGGQGYPYTVGLLNSWLAASGYMIVPPEQPARYECRITGLQENRHDGGGDLSTPWGNANAHGSAWRVRVLFALYDANRVQIFDSASIDAGTAGINQRGNFNVDRYSGYIYGSGETISDAIKNFFTKLPPAPAPVIPTNYSPVIPGNVSEAIPCLDPTQPITMWIDMTHGNRRVIISSLPGTKFWTRFFATNSAGQRVKMTSTNLREITQSGSYTLWNEASTPRIVDIIVEGENNPRRSIILLPGGRPVRGERF